MSDTHICPTCSQPCIYKNGIMCTIQGCIKDGTSKNGDIFSTLFGNKNGSNDSTVDALRSVFGMK